MSTRIKRQHYVPQGYLRRFQSDNSTVKVSRIWVVDRNKDAPFNVPIQTVASRDGFYDSEIDKGINEFEQHGLENLLRIEENKFYVALRTLDEAISAGNEIPADAKPAIPWYLYLQFIRTSKFRESLSDDEGSAGPDFKKLTQIYGFTNKEMAAKFMSVYISTTWVIYRMAGRQVMFTTDNPVVFTFDSASSALASVMRGEDLVFRPYRGMRIMFPLDSKHVLFLYDSEAVPDKIDLANQVVDFDASEAYSLWSALINSCDRQVYLPINDGMCQVIKSLMDLDSTLQPLREALEVAVNHVRFSNSSVTNTRLNSYRGYIARKEVESVFNTVKDLSKSSDEE